MDQLYYTIYNPNRTVILLGKPLEHNSKNLCVLAAEDDEEGRNNNVIKVVNY